MGATAPLPFDPVRLCNACRTLKPVADFYDRSDEFRNYQCRLCKNVANMASYYKNKTRYRANQRRYEKRRREQARTDKALHAKLLLKQCRGRARFYKIPFALTLSDIHVPEACPVLGLPLTSNRGAMKPNSATIDRIDPSLGYIPGNVIVVSLRANVIKTNATPEEIMKVAVFYTSLAAKKIA